MKGYKLTPIRQTAQQVLNDAALSFSYTMTKDGWFHWAGIKFGVSVTETAAVTFDSPDGAAYDILLDSVTGAQTNYIFRPNTPILLKKGDVIVVSCTNGTATTTASMTAFFEEVETWIS